MRSSNLFSMALILTCSMGADGAKFQLVSPGRVQKQNTVCKKSDAGVPPGEALLYWITQKKQYNHQLVAELGLS